MGGAGASGGGVGGGAGGTPSTGGTPSVAGTQNAGGAPSAGAGADTSTAGTPATGGSAGAGGVGTGGTDMSGAGTSGGGQLDPAAIIVEDDFDDSTAGGWPDEAKWMPYPDWARMQGFAPVIDSAKSHSPPNSVRVTSTNVGDGSFLVPVMGKLPTPENRYYVRVWMNWEKATATIMGHSGFIVGATARDNSGTEVRLGISSKGPGDQAMMDLNLIGGPGGEVTRYSNGFTDGGDPSQASGNGFQFQADTWVCLEALFDGAGHEFRVWVDDVEIEAMHVTDFRGSPNAEPRTMWAPNYTYLKIGAQDYDANLGKIWYDDVVIAKERVGCR